MPAPNPGSTRLALTNSQGLGRLEVDLEAFFAFSFDLAEDLEDLVQTYRPKPRPPATPMLPANRIVHWPSAG
ncbi:MAG: hypothetical protein J5I93_16350 [Pirellulaceae bacterium]|nr:hypothetical protein [Pirellulaceae bacterium]